MKSYFLTAALLITAITSFYFASCSSAEQTTAKLAYQRGEYKKAEEEFVKELKTNPSNEEAWFYLAMSRVQLKNPEGTKEAIEKYKALKLNTYGTELVNAWITLNENAAKLFETGNQLVTQKKEDEGVKKFTEANENFGFAYILIPESTFVKENIDKINNRINAITIKPIIDKGVEYESQGNYDAAINEYKKAVDKFSKGTANYEVIIFDIALAELKWAEKIKKTNEDVPEDKWDMTYKDKYNDALPYTLDLTKSKDPCTRINGYELIVQIYANTGKNEDAKNAIEERKKLKEEHPECLKDNK
jgi:tetratricopeptide (TPR) repeat protein